MEMAARLDATPAADAAPMSARSVRQRDPDNDVPYRSFPVEWTAPERLAIASFLHGGPVPALETSRVMELGCGDGANLLPMAYYRRTSSFVGVDASAEAIASAREAQQLLGLDNIVFVCAPFSAAAARVDGTFDFVIAHGVFSWIDDSNATHSWRCAVTGCVIGVCSSELQRAARMAHPWPDSGVPARADARRRGSRARADAAQSVAATVVASLGEQDHSYTRLIADEFDFVRRSHPS